jgi:hypothetical protein
MKKLFISATLIAFGVFAFQGCSKDDANSVNETKKGAITIDMTDAPGDFNQVNVDIRHVDIHYTDNGWIRLETKSGIYDLLTLRDSVTTRLVDKDSMPVGEITQIRLILGPDNSVMVDSVLYDLKVPSGEQSGIKINVNKLLNFDDETYLLIDFDAEKSIVYTGNSNYILKPVIRVLK